MTHGDLKRIGYWLGRYESGLPAVGDFVDFAWDAAERQLVIDYLKSGKEHAQYRGLSNCRFCHCSNGSRDLSDGVYVWPSGLAHYLECHGVRLPQEFVDHVKVRP